MELQFNKTMIPCLKTLVREVQNQEQTQDVRLTDEMPDVGTVIASWGQIIIRGKEWRGNSMNVSGGVMAWVLYDPDEGGAPKCVETWLPFQMKWDFPDSERDGSIHIVPLLRSVDARVLSARKIMVRSSVSILGEAMLPGEVEVYEPGEIPEDICLQKQRFFFQIPIEAGEKAFALEESIPIPASTPQYDKIIRYQLRPELTDHKIVADKVVFRGVAMLHVLYQGEDGQMYAMDFDIPFSQYTELDREQEPDSIVNMNLIVTNLELERGEESNLILKAGMSGQYIVFGRSFAEIVSDAYSPRRGVTPERISLQLPSLLDYLDETMAVQQDVSADCNHGIDIDFCPEHPRVYHEGDSAVAEMAGMFGMLHYEESGQLVQQNPRWNGNWTIPAENGVRVEVYLQPVGKVQMTAGNGTVTLKADMRVIALITEGQGIPMVTSLAVTEPEEPNPGRPSLIICRVGAEGLWGLAKRAGSTVEMIEKANGLNEEPLEGTMLLVPVM